MATTPIVLHRAVMSSSVVPGAFHESGAQTSHGSAASSFNLVQSTKRSLTKTASIIPPNALVKAQSSASVSVPVLTNPFLPGGALNPTGPVVIGKVNPPVTGGPLIPGVPTKITFTGPGGSNLPGPTDQGGGPTIVPPTTSLTNPGTTTPPTTADLLNSLFGGTPTNEGGSLAVVPVQSGQASDSSSSDSSNSKTGLMVVLFALGAGVAWYWWKHKGPGKG